MRQPECIAGSAGGAGVTAAVGWRSRNEDKSMAAVVAAVAGPDKRRAKLAMRCRFWSGSSRCGCQSGSTADGAEGCG